MFAGVDTEAAGGRCSSDEGLLWSRPHHSPQTHAAAGGDSWPACAATGAGRTPMHRLSLFGYDDEGREALERIGLSVRPARAGSRWLAL